MSQFRVDPNSVSKARSQRVASLYRAKKAAKNGIPYKNPYPFRTLIDKEKNLVDNPLLPRK